MGIFQQFPYSNFHEMNLDEIIRILREMQDEWADTKAEWASYKDFIDNYFENLDLDDEVLRAIQAMAASGELNQVIDPVIANETADWLADHITQPTTPVVDTSLTVAGAAADAKVVGDKFDDLSLRNILAGIYDTVTSFIKTPSFAWDVTTTPVPGDAYYYVKYDVTGFESVKVSGRSWGSRYPLIAFYDSSNVLLGISGEPSQEYYDVIVAVPAGASYCYVNGATYSTNVVTLKTLMTTTAFNVTLKSMQEIVDACNSVNILDDPDEADPNTIYRFYFSGYLAPIEVAHLPFSSTTSTMGALITLGKEITSTGYRTQIFISENDGIFFRYASDGGYVSWKTLTPRSIDIRYNDDVIGKFITAATDPNIKDVYIHAGNYDVLSLYELHYGADFFTNYTGYSSGDNDFGRGIVLKSGKRYHFSTGAVFEANYTGANTAVTNYFSMFAPEYGYDLTINGLNINECNNLRYAVHVDFAMASNTTGGTLEFVNCMLGCDDRPIGAGLHDHTRLKLTDSVFVCNTDTVDVHVHTPNTQGASGELIVTGCYFNTRLQVGQGGTNTTHSKAYVTNNSWHLLVNEPPQVFDVVQFNNVTH